VGTGGVWPVGLRRNGSAKGSGGWAVEQAVIRKTDKIKGKEYKSIMINIIRNGHYTQVYSLWEGGWKTRTIPY
jgi:hypothetical protein